MAATRGTVTLRVIEAHFEEAFVDAPVNSTYCAVCVLEKTRWRRRRSQARGRGAGEDPMRPVWNEEFELDEVRDDSRIVVDVWNCAAAGGDSDAFYGKVTLRLAELALAKLSTDAAWHELLPGRIQLQLRWDPADGDGTPLAAPIPRGAPLPLTADAVATYDQNGGAAAAAAAAAKVERAAVERAAAERAAVERAAAERAAAERAEAERVAAERAEAERVAAERAEAEKREREQQEERDRLERAARAREEARRREEEAEAARREQQAAAARQRVEAARAERKAR